MNKEKECQDNKERTCLEKINKTFVQLSRSFVSFASARQIIAT